MPPESCGLGIPCDTELDRHEKLCLRFIRQTQLFYLKDFRRELLRRLLAVSIRYRVQAEEQSIYYDGDGKAESESLMLPVFIYCHIRTARRS